MFNKKLAKNMKVLQNFFKVTAIVAGLFLFILSPLSLDLKNINFIKAETIINFSSINTDTVWTLAGSPYVITSSAFFVNASLTIEPGVIVKIDHGTFFVVKGELIAQGNDSEPIIFTSINDDAAGGKTVSWSTGNPLPGDWGAIEVRDGRAILDNIKVRYGGEICIYEVRANPIKITTAYAGWCYDDGAILGSGDITINNSEIHDNRIGLSFFNVPGLTINNSEIYNNVKGGLINRGENQLNATDNWWGDNSGPYHRELNPDGQGDSIVGDVLFDPWIGKATEPKLNPVILVPGFFGSWKGLDGKLELDPIMHTYDNLWEALKLAGYEQDNSLFAFPYNWRQSNATSSLLLKEKISEVKEVCQDADLDDYDCEKVDLVAHSMGGIVARAYIESDSYEEDVDQLIFLATPHKGSPQAYLSWEGGEAGLGFEKFIMEKIIFAEAVKHGYPTNFSYIRNLPMISAKELLPTFNYLRDKGSDSLRTYFFDYPRNEFLENLNNKNNLEKLEEVRILNIVAQAKEASSTISAFRVVDEDYADGRWQYGYPENYGRLFTDHGLEYGPGDNTVPSISNIGFNSFDEVIINDSGHLEIVTDAQNFVIEELTGLRPEQSVKKNFIKKLLLIRIFSPADFVIISPDGKKLGKDFINQQNISEIEGAFYSGFENGEEFATIPDPLDGEYQINLQGTGEGEYKLSVSGIGEATSIDKEFVGQISSGIIQEFKINYSSSTPNILEELEPQDVVPPSLNINFPIEGGEYKHSDKIIISYEANDDFSGLGDVSLKIDDDLITTTTIDLFNYQIGTHTLDIIVFDQAGNSTEKSVSFQIISNIKSTIADIEEIYKRGWLNSFWQKNILIGELKVLDFAFSVLDREKDEINKKIEETRNNLKLKNKAKEVLIANLNKKLIKINESRQKIIKLNLDIFEKTLDRAKKFNYLNSTGYDIIKENLKYLKNNL